MINVTPTSTQHTALDLLNLSPEQTALEAVSYTHLTLPTKRIV